MKPAADVGRRSLRSLGPVVFFLALVEITSGILQGYYTPILTDIARRLGISDGDVNWFEAAQLMLSALAVPVLAKLGDIHGHKRILLVSTVVTAAASWGVAFAPDFWTFLAAWSLQGFYVVWLPLEIALIFGRAAGSPGGAALTRKAAGLLVGALQFGVIVGALAAGALVEVFAGRLELTLMIPAAAVTLCIAAIHFGVPETTDRAGGILDGRGFLLLAFGLLLITSGLSFLRINGPGTWWVWLVLLSGVAALVPFVRYELGLADPLVDFRMLREKSMWPVQLTAGLFGISVLGAQAPMSTFARTDRGVHGYGLGLDAGDVSIIIGSYVLSVLLGALIFPVVARRTTPRLTLCGAAALVGIGYLLFLPFHDTLAQTLTNMIVAGLGSGALVAALPSAAAAAAPRNRTGMATGLTNTTKTIGGSFASAVFGIALLSAATDAVAGGTGLQTAAPLSGYLTVWAVCSGTGFLAAGLLLLVPRLAFSDVPLTAADTGTPGP
ncbi:MFS transporter [Arthrobacter sp. zg-Y820]|uniref:MFS transporter n=1 Tax=unclassified Arthrobacter TaxID=235627 RepID=UPI002541B663|nr:MULTISPECIES: MFS transporter [unclassified Arthrobacter]MCC9196146.1 MFS transporter [Arthrobacter sp. zg-Y820]MDK1279006.1 MFS transporter [Arthrobacter sp. zg.Y820]WIB08584.1 MFS transporter [Arthrobacter sp. zg-Y820]